MLNYDITDNVNIVAKICNTDLKFYNYLCIRTVNNDLNAIEVFRALNMMLEKISLVSDKNTI